MEKKIVYFQRAGKHNTQETLELAKERGEELGVGTFVIASTWGFTARKALEIFADAEVTFVFVGENPADFPQDLRAAIEAEGHSTAFLHDLNPDIPEEVDNAYRRFGEGMKVAAQCVAVAVDAGLVPKDAEVVAVGGTGPWAFPEGGGADTAIVMEAIGGAGYTERYKPSKKPVWRKIHEVVCKPR